MLVNCFGFWFGWGLQFPNLTLFWGIYCESNSQIMVSWPSLATCTLCPIISTLKEKKDWKFAISFLVQDLENENLLDDDQKVPNQKEKKT